MRILGSLKRTWIVQIFSTSFWLITLRDPVNDLLQYQNAGDRQHSQQLHSLQKVSSQKLWPRKQPVTGYQHLNQNEFARKHPPNLYRQSQLLHPTRRSLQLIKLFNQRIQQQQRLWKRLLLLKNSNSNSNLHFHPLYNHKRMLRDQVNTNQQSIHHQWRMKRPLYNNLLVNHQQNFHHHHHHHQTKAISCQLMKQQRVSQYQPLSRNIHSKHHQRPVYTWTQPDQRHLHLQYLQLLKRHNFHLQDL